MLRLMSLQEFFTNPQPSMVIEDIRYQMENDSNLIDEVGLREGQNWSYLAGKVVGAEE